VDRSTVKLNYLNYSFSFIKLRSASRSSIGLSFLPYFSNFLISFSSLFRVRASLFYKKLKIINFKANNKIKNKPTLWQVVGDQYVFWLLLAQH